MTYICFFFNIYICILLFIFPPKNCDIFKYLVKWEKCNIIHVGQTCNVLMLCVYAFYNYHTSHWSEFPLRFSLTCYIFAIFLNNYKLFQMTSTFFFPFPRCRMIIVMLLGKYFFYYWINSVDTDVSLRENKINWKRFLSF